MKNNPGQTSDSNSLSKKKQLCSFAEEIYVLTAFYSWNQLVQRWYLCCFCLLLLLLLVLLDSSAGRSHVASSFCPSPLPPPPTPSRKGCVVNGQMAKASNKRVRPPPSHDSHPQLMQQHHQLRGATSECQAGPFRH